jgi:hypothetical protein
MDETGSAAEVLSPTAVATAAETAGTAAGPAPSYTPTALLRADLARELAVLVYDAAALVPTGPDADRQPGDLVAELAKLVTRAESALGAAVAVERTYGTSWETIGRPFAIGKGGAQKKFKAAVEDADLRCTETTFGHQHLTVAALHERTVRSAELAEWYLAQRTNPRDPWAGHPHPVADALPRHTPVAELQAIDADERALHQAAAIPDPHALAELCDRRAWLYDRLAEQGRADEAPQWAARERARAAALRNQPAGAIGWDRPAAVLAPAPQDQDGAADAPSPPPSWSSRCSTC